MFEIEEWPRQDGTKFVTVDEIKREVQAILESVVRDLAVDREIVHLLTQEHRVSLIDTVTKQEILNSIGDSKAPGADGFSVKYF